MAGRRLVGDAAIGDKYVVIAHREILAQETNDDGSVTIRFQPVEHLDEVDRYFVLRPRTDQAALLALEEYFRHAYPELRKSIRHWISAIRRRGLRLSTTGRMNASYIDCCRSFHEDEVYHGHQAGRCY